MATEFKHLDVHFDPASGGRSPLGPFTVIFSQHVNSFTVVLQDFDVSFANGDHHLGRLIINPTAVQSPMSDRAVDVTVDYLLRDFSGNADDPYQGDIGVNVIADVG